MVGVTGTRALPDMMTGRDAGLSLFLVLQSYLSGPRPSLVPRPLPLSRAATAGRPAPSRGGYSPHAQAGDGVVPGGGVHVTVLAVRGDVLLGISVPAPARVPAREVLEAQTQRWAPRNTPPGNN